MAFLQSACAVPLRTITSPARALLGGIIMMAGTAIALGSFA